MAKQQGLSTKDLQVGFNVGHMTIYNWRQGTATKDPLPADVDEETKRVSFNAGKVKAWAKKHGLEFSVPTEKAVQVKPGPKPKAEAAAAVENVKRKSSARADVVSNAMEAAKAKTSKRAKANVAQVSQ